jgi:integrase
VLRAAALVDIRVEHRMGAAPRTRINPLDRDQLAKVLDELDPVNAAIVLFAAETGRRAPLQRRRAA